AVGWHRFSTKLSLVQGGLNLTLSIILVRKYGTIGVALATLIAFLLTNFIGNIVYFRRKMRLLAGSG
ncbi:MAG: polysaccharide biosynthesis C-terminal domain-containing protein, partial [candidate division Zixibacteria bacterium]|nr:polysaccharide biosynthesis C-terminal domain-containing protein [candidate division Zixibacteria bacterium]